MQSETNGIARNHSILGGGNCRFLSFPGFPVEFGGVAIFMRFSLQKTAHAALPSAACRKSGFARNDKERRVGSATTPLKPKEGLNGPPKLCLVISPLYE
jgi:hypothetical protein